MAKLKFQQSLLHFSLSNTSEIILTFIIICNNILILIFIIIIIINIYYLFTNVKNSCAA